MCLCAIAVGKKPLHAGRKVSNRMDTEKFFQFLHTAEHLKDNTRHSVTSQNRPESVAEHSWRVSLMAMMLENEIEGVDFNKVIRMCILHDLGEAITGDIPSFQKTKADSAHEDAVLFQLLDTLYEPLSSQWKELFEEMLALETPEARVYKALDKLEAVIQHNEAPLESWLPLEYELNQTYGVKEASCHPVLAALRQKAVEDTRKKIEDK